MAVEYNINIKDKYFYFIKNGMKTVEGRINKNKFEQMEKDDIIIFSSSTETLKCIVTGTEVYDSFYEMLEKEGIQNCLPDVKNIKEGVEIYHGFGNYKKDAKKYGVKAIRISVIKTGGSECVLI